MDNLPVENPWGQPLQESQKVQKQTQKEAACGHTLRADPWKSKKNLSNCLYVGMPIQFSLSGEFVQEFHLLRV